jgi:hypothetical protein
MARSGFLRAKKGRPCEICGKPDYCVYLPLDGKTLWCCMRVKEGSFGRTRDHRGWMHFRDGGSGARLRDEANGPGRAPLHRRHVVYTGLLDRCALKPEHVDSLKRRGLSEHAIARYGYSSVADVANELALAGHALERVPGFFVNPDTGEWTSMALDGFFIPVRDRRGRIQALQIRCDWRGGPKYVWFSSAELFGGASSGAPAHHHTDVGSEFWVTESPLKADVVHAHLGVPVIGIAGVWTAHAAVCEFLLDPRCERAVVAFDDDWRTNSHVIRALVSLLASIIEHTNRMPDVAFWNGARGVDDALAIDAKIMRLPADKWFASGHDTIYRVAQDPEFMNVRARSILGYSAAN